MPNLDNFTEGSENGHPIANWNDKLNKTLWAAADNLRGSVDAAEYKHVVLGLIFLKYISDSFEEAYEEIKNDPDGLSDPELRDEYTAKNIFWVPADARWSFLLKNAKQPTIGNLIDKAMESIEKENSGLRGILPTDYSRPGLDKRRLGEIIDLIGSIGFGDKESRERDVLGSVYEYFLGKFAAAEGKKAGQFYTPQSIVKLLVEMIEPLHGRVYDPCCGSGGMFVHSERFVKAHTGRLDNIHVYGQEFNLTTWKLCKMNLAIRNIESDQVMWNSPGSLLSDLHKDLKADFILANPPFNDEPWGAESLKNDARWKYGSPPAGNANFAWVQHFIHHLSPTGVAGFVLANGSMSSNTSNEGEIRKNIIEDDLVDCMVALPDKLFVNTGISACLWFVSRDKQNNKFRNRKREVLFIDARKLGTLVNRRERILSDDDIATISNTYHSWRGEEGFQEYQDMAGFCKSASLEDIKRNSYALTPGRYVGSKEMEEDEGEFQERMEELTTELSYLMEEEKKLNDEIKNNLRSIGFELR